MFDLLPLEQGVKFNELMVESIDETITDLLGRTVVDALYTHLQTNLFHLAE